MITGAAGTLGGKLRQHLAGRHDLRLLDRDPRGDPGIERADLSTWSGWVRRFEQADVVFHFAADPEAYRPWPDLVGPNMDAMIHTFAAAAAGRVRRFVFASSNHVMGGYRDETGVALGPETPPRPGLRYRIAGTPQNSTPYAAGKLFGERLARCYAQSHGMEAIALRIGWVWRGGPNLPQNLPADRGDWFRLMWLSDRDFLHLADRCLVAELPEPFVVVNGMSNNTGMAWDLEPGRRVLGYEPQDDVTAWTEPWGPTTDES